MRQGFTRKLIKNKKQKQTDWSNNFKKEYTKNKLAVKQQIKWIFIFLL